MYILQYGLTMGAGRSMNHNAKHITEDVLREMDRLAVRDAGEYEPTILTRHVAEAIKNIIEEERPEFGYDRKPNDT
jgi:hypothetical protein